MKRTPYSKCPKCGGCHYYIIEQSWWETILFGPKLPSVELILNRATMECLYTHHRREV